MHSGNEISTEFFSREARKSMFRAALDSCNLRFNGNHFLIQPVILLTPILPKVCTQNIFGSLQSFEHWTMNQIFFQLTDAIPYLQCISPYIFFCCSCRYQRRKIVALFLRLERVVISVRCRYPEFMLIQWRYQDMSRYLFNLLNGSPGWGLI